MRYNDYERARACLGLFTDSSSLLEEGLSPNRTAFGQNQEI